MYGIEFPTTLPGSKERITVVANCKSINGYDVIGLTLRFVNERDVVIIPAFNREFFDDCETEACNALLEDYYNHEFSCLM